MKIEEIDMQQSHQNQHRRQTNNRNWVRPEVNILKANTDANLRESGTWGLGAIIKNDLGMVMAAATWKRQGYDSAITAEAFSILSVMQLAIDYGFRRMVFENDCEKLIQILKKEKMDDRTCLGLLVCEIHKLSRIFEICRFNFTSRNSNNVAHNIAQLAHSEPNLIWMEEVPNSIYEMYFRKIQLY